MRKLLFLFACFFLASIGLASAQTGSISGKVLSAENDEPIVGATVVLKGTNVAAITNGDGVFVINQKGSAKTLRVSFIGMTPVEVQVAPNMVIKMEADRMNLDEIIVTGLGIKRSEKALGYSATAVSSADITMTGNKSAFSALQGKIPGVEINSASGAPGASTRVIMRGATTLAGSNQPLYVIDGVPMNNGAANVVSLNGGMDFGNRANDINPEDIESISVLQGGSATALYGSRASSGVIIITTKSGSKNGTKAKVDFSSTTTFESPLRLPVMQNEYGQGWYNRSTDQVGDLQENGSWGPRFDGEIRKWGFVVNNQQQIKPYVALENNIKDFFDTGVTLNNSVSVSGGDANKSFYISYGNIVADGIMPSDVDSYKRNNLSLKGSLKLFNFIDVSSSLNYIRKDSRYVITGQEQSVLDGVWQTPRDISLVDQMDYNNKFKNVENYFTIYSQNPYYVLNEHGTRYGEDRAYGNIFLNAKLLPWLSASFRVGGDAANSTMKAWRAITLNQWGYNDETGMVSEQSSYVSELNTDFMLMADKDFGDDLNIKAVVGHNFNERNSRSIGIGVTGLNIPGFYDISNSSATPTVSASISKRRMVGVYGSLDIGYRNMLYLNVTGRNDISSTLPAANNSYFYPAVSLSYIFSEMLEDKGILSFGKIRAGVARTGKDADPYQVYNILTQTSLTDGYRTLEFPLMINNTPVNAFTVSNTLRNDQLKPEMSQDLEVGLDLKFLQDRVGVSASVYNKVVTDLIWGSTIPGTTGYSAQIQNLGKITNKGVEVSLNATPVRTKDLEWEIYVNYSKNENMLNELNDGLEVISLGGTSSMQYVARPGHPLGLYEGTVPATDPQDHVIVDAQGLPTFESEYGVLGTSQNDFRIGGGTSLRYKNYRFGATFDYRKGGVMYSRTAEMMYFTGNAPQTTYNDRQPFIVPNSVQLVNGDYVENTVPISGFSNNLNLFYNQTYNAGLGAAYSLVDKTFFKLRELSIAYSVSKEALPKQINNLEIALVGNNLLLWTPNSNLFTDPEQTTFGNDLEADYGDFGATPSCSSFGINVRLGF